MSGKCAIHAVMLQAEKAMWAISLAGKEGDIEVTMVSPSPIPTL
ncbi:hypothetical protein [Serratia proteamaculans]|nr:hypothetical protein [Serratia proteamaculans]